MVHIEERVRIIEARMADHSELFADLRQGLLRFEERVDRRFEQIDHRFEQIDRRFEQIDRRFLELEGKFEGRFTTLETRITALDRKIDEGMAALNLKIDTGLAAQGAEIAALRRDITTLFTTQFRWTAGIMITGVMAIVAAILAG